MQCSKWGGLPYQNFLLFLNFILALLFSKNTNWYGMFLNNALAERDIEEITSCTVLPIKVDHCNTQVYLHILLTFNISVPPAPISEIRK
jgi:hypothetical protein